MDKATSENEDYYGWLKKHKLVDDDFRVITPKEPGLKHVSELYYHAASSGTELSQALGLLGIKIKQLK